MATTLHPTPMLDGPLTYDDLIAMPADGQRYELINGEVCVSPAPHRLHQKVSFRLTLQVGSHVEPLALGELYYAPVDVRLSPHDIVQPDLIFLLRDRLHLYRGSVVEGPPDIVVEILSPSTRQTDLVRKAALYARAGVPEYWQLDLEARTLRILALHEGQYREVAPDDEGRLRSIILPDLLIDLQALFGDLG